MSKPTTYIKLDRGILDWEWFADDCTLKVWLFLLCRANFKDSRTEDGYAIRRGEVVLTVSEVAEKCRKSVRNVRTALTHLTDSGEIEKVFSTKRFTVFRIVKYDIYQNSRQSNRQSNRQFETVAAQGFEPF